MGLGEIDHGLKIPLKARQRYLVAIGLKGSGCGSELRLLSLFNVNAKFFSVLSLENAARCPCIDLSQDADGPARTTANRYRKLNPQSGVRISTPQPEGQRLQGSPPPKGKVFGFDLYHEGRRPLVANSRIYFFGRSANG